MKKIYFYKNKFSNKGYYCNWLFKPDNTREMPRLLSYKDKNNELIKTNLSKKYQNILLKSLIKKLNKDHNINYSSRFWKILLNRWVKFYVDAIIFRYFYLKKNISESGIKKFYFRFNPKKNIPNSLSEFHEILNNEERNNYLCYKITNYLKNEYPEIKCNIKKIKKKIKSKIFFNILNTLNIKIVIFNLINFFFKFFLKKNSPIITSTYLPKYSELNLKIKKSSIFFWKHFYIFKNFQLTNLFSNKYVDKRNKFFFTNNNDKLKSIIFDLVDDFFPSFYYENFKDVKKYVSKNLILNKPSFIFTSNEFLFNEFFKFHLVHFLQYKKTKYYVGQHGSKYGSTLEQERTIEEETADKFITWGWKNYKNNIPFGVLNTSEKKFYNEDKQITKMIIVNENFPDLNTIYDTSQKYHDSFNRTLKFIKGIDRKFYKNITFRIHHEDFQHQKFFINKIKKINKEIKIDLGKKNIFDLLDSNTLVVFTYYSSGFLELLSLNKKSFLLFDLDKRIYMKKFFKKFIKLKNKLIFDNPIELSILTNRMIKDTINYQLINSDKDIIDFKKEYAKYVPSIKTLNKIL